MKKLWFVLLMGCGGAAATGTGTGAGTGAGQTYVVVDPIEVTDSVTTPLSTDALRKSVASGVMKSFPDVTVVIDRDPPANARVFHVAAKVTQLEYGEKDVQCRVTYSVLGSEKTLLAQLSTSGSLGKQRDDTAVCVEATTGQIEGDLRKFLKP